MTKTSTGELLGHRIKALRKARGLTQEKLGEESKVNYKFLGSLERGLENPSVATLEKIAASLDVELMEFFRFHHEETDPAELKKLLIDVIDHIGQNEVEKLQLILKIINAIK